MEAIRKYGSLDAKGRLGMYYTMSLMPNSAGLLLTINDVDIAVQHISGEIIVTWELATLAERFSQKIPALVLVTAHTEERAGIEYFHFYRSQLMQATKKELLAELFKAGHLFIDLRLHDKGTAARNHGTAFRVHQHKLPSLFNELIDI